MSTEARRYPGAMAVGLVALAAAACGDAGPPPPPQLGPPVLVIVYQGTSAERPLIEAMLHRQRAAYRGSANRLSSPLAPGARVEIRDFVAGNWFLTVVRKKLSLPTSDLLALTTAEPLSLQTGLTEVWVFDESFRVFDPVPSVDGGAGVRDAGLEAGPDAGLDTGPDGGRDLALDLAGDGGVGGGADVAAPEAGGADGGDA